jgi:hypothetical protein
MTWRELSFFLHSQRIALDPRPVSEFGRIGEKATTTFKRLDKKTRKPIDKAVLEFAKTKKWARLSD